MRIIGVDFSGAQREVGKTWIAEGSLSDDGVLTLNSCCSISRDCLTKKLAGLDEPAVVAMDFPFSVPAEFATRWSGYDKSWEMPNLWAAAGKMDLAGFIELRNKFAARHGEQKRACDPPESSSALNIRMMPMTFWGMRMLNRIWACQTVNSLLVPPLPSPRTGTGDHTTTLLEVMPGVVLHRLGLPFRGYKDGRGQEQRKQRKQTRKCILEKLPSQVKRVQVDLSCVYDKCLSNAQGDALDSVVAAIAAALWATDRTLFQLPPEQGQPGYDPFILLEGWLYAPKGCCQPWWLDKLAGQ